jgi:hypothetical protein
MTARTPGNHYLDDLPVKIMIGGAEIGAGNKVPCDVAVSASIAAFQPKAKTTLSTSSASSRVAFASADPSLLLRNVGATDAYYALGDNTIAATTGSYLIKAGEAIVLDVTGFTYLAGITASGTTTLNLVSGTGLSVLSQPGGGGGGAGGAVTITDRTEVTGSASSAAVLSGFPVTDTTGYRAMALQVTAIAASSTLLVEESNDGTTWTALTSIGGMASVTAVGLYVYNFSAKQIRVRQSVYGGSGTSSVTAELRLDAAPHDYAIGAPADAQATDATSSWSVIALLKGLYTKLGAVVLAAGTAVIGKVGIDQTTPGTTDSVSVATGQGAGATIGVTSGAAVITDANGTVQQYLRGLVKQWIAGTLVLGAGAVGGYTPGKLIAANTTNATSIKGSAGTVGFLSFQNKDASPVYVKFYDKASAPTVGTDTPVAVFMVPGNASGTGNNPPLPPQGLAFATGIAMAVTAGIADADTTAVPASAVTVNYGYK